MQIYTKYQIKNYKNIIKRENWNKEWNYYKRQRIVYKEQMTISCSKFNNKLLFSRIKMITS